jgi:hypothetical protein
MEYIVTSPTKLGGKEFGEIFTEKELLDVGANIDVLLAAGSIKKATPAPQVRQAPQVSDFKSTNEEGDK